MKITVIGTGYVGLVASVGFADMGHHVFCVDKDPEKIKSLQNHRVPIYEPGLEDILKSAGSRLNFSMDLDQALRFSDIIFIAVGTPESSDGRADLTEVFKIVERICSMSVSSKTIVVKSTVPVGTSRKIRTLIGEKTDQEIDVVNNPEFLKEGTAVDDFLRPDRVVIGCHSEKARKIMSRLYAPFLRNGHPIHFMSNTSAELTKYAANAFLSIKISFANELALLADALGADTNEVRKGFTSDSRINSSFFYPGVGYGGSCFPKDIQALIRTAEEQDCTMDLVQSADRINDRQKTILVDKILRRFGGNIKGMTFALWGLSFKPQTDDVREAPAGYIIKRLSDEGAVVKAYDPMAMESAKKYFSGRFNLLGSALSACQSASALLIVTEWNEFRNPDYLELAGKLKQKIIFDGRNALNPVEVKKHGFEYHCIGRQSFFEGLE